MSDLHISLVAEEVFRIGDVSVTNSMFTGWIVTIFVSFALLSIVTSLKKKPGIVQNLFESLYTFIYSTAEDIVGKDIAQRVFPLLLTIFLFILFGSWIGLLPGVGSLGFFEEAHNEKIGVPLFRAVTADINSAIALSLIAFLVIEFYGFRANGIGYLKKFITFSSPVNFFVGILELISEVMRILTFSFRLFGNIFAGEVILTVMLSLAAALVLPFLGFEVFVGLIQAFVFVMLICVFISLSVEKTEHH